MPNISSADPISLLTLVVLCAIFSYGLTVLEQFPQRDEAPGGFVWTSGICFSLFFFIGVFLRDFSSAILISTKIHLHCSCCAKKDLTKGTSDNIFSSKTEYSSKYLQRNDSINNDLWLSIYRSLMLWTIFPAEPRAHWGANSFLLSPGSS